MTRHRSAMRRGRSIGARIISVAAVIGIIALGGIVQASPGGTVENPVDGGSLRLFEFDNPDVELAGGVSSTVFTIEPPDDAMCPGDSANDDWRIQSFLVPAEVDPLDLQFASNDPEGEGNWSLYGADTSPFVDELTAPNTVPGKPARFPTIRPMSFACVPARHPA